LHIRIAFSTNDERTASGCLMPSGLDGDARMKNYAGMPFAMHQGDAMVDKMVGDEVIGIYLPVSPGSDYRQRVVAAGLTSARYRPHQFRRSLAFDRRRRTCRQTFVGSIGVEGGTISFQALVTR